MSYSVQDLKADLTGVIHGTTLSKVVNLDGLINRSARQLLEDVDPMETQRILEFATPVFEDAYSYYLAPDVKGNAIIDIRPVVNRFPGQVYNQDYSQQFDRSKELSLNNQFHIQWNQGVRTLLLNSPLLTTGITVNYASSLTDNGTWAGGGDVTNLSIDNTNWIAGGGSLKFDLTGASNVGYLENSTMESVDLADFLNQSYWFLYMYLPSVASGFTNINLAFGSSTVDYYSVDAMVTQAGTVFQNGWNQLSYDWNNLTTNGTPDPSDITFIRVAFAYDGDPRTAVRLNNITCLTGEIMEYVYYSKYLFRDATTGAFQETVTDESNLINLDTDSYNLLFNKVAYYVAQQLQGADAMFDASYWLKEYDDSVTKYKNMYKGERQKPMQSYYNMTKGGYNGYLTRRW